MAIKNVELMHQCCPKHMRWGTARTKDDRRDKMEECKKRKVNMEKGKKWIWKKEKSEYGKRRKVNMEKREKWIWKKEKSEYGKRRKVNMERSTVGLKKRCPNDLTIVRDCRPTRCILMWRVVVTFNVVLIDVWKWRVVVAFNVVLLDVLEMESRSHL